MKRRLNLFVWAGFLIAVLASLSYFVLFARFPITRDFPWVNLPLFVVAGVLLVMGLRRAFSQPEAYRGKISGPILATLSMLILGLFLFYVFRLSKRLPSSRGAPQVGQKAPDFTLPDKDGHPVTLSQLLSSTINGGENAAEKAKGVVLIFYRGYW